MLGFEAETMADELQAMASVAQTLDGVEEKESRKRILTWAWAKYVGGSPESTADESVRGGRGSKKRADKKTGKKVSKSKKSTFSLVKDLNLQPKGKESLKDFVARKSPTNMRGKITVAVYYLTQVIGVGQVSVDHIYTCFKWMNWKLPAQFVNMIHQAGAKGWLETADRDNIMLTTLGENLVEHELSAD